MNKLTASLDDFSVNSHDDGYSLEDAINQHNLIAEHANAIPKRAIEAKGWNLSSLSANYIQSQTLYRKHDTASNAKLALWLAKSQEHAKQFFIKHQGMPDFTGISKEELGEIARLSPDESVIVELPEILAFKGIILIYQPALEGTKVDGASFMLANKYPVISLSLRQPRMDNFWFTLMHELAHVCLHKEKLVEPIVDVFNDEAEAEPIDDIEIQANILARDSFVSKVTWRTSTFKNTESKQEINRFAEASSLHPAIVAGLARHHRKRYDLFSDIVNKTNPRILLGIEV